MSALLFCNVLAVTCIVIHLSELFLFSHSRMAGQHWCFPVSMAMKKWWRLYWMEGPQFIYKQRYYSTG